MFYKHYAANIKKGKYSELLIDINTIVNQIVCDVEQCCKFTDQLTELYNLKESYQEKWQAKTTVFKELALRDIYIEQYAYQIHNFTDLQTKVYDTPEKSFKLDDEIVHWYLDEPSMCKGRLLYLLGEPGHGKSSFCTYMMNAYPHYRINVINFNDSNYMQLITNDISSVHAFENFFNRFFESDFRCMGKSIVILDGYDEPVSLYNKFENNLSTSFFEAFHNSLQNIILRTQDT